MIKFDLKKNLAFIFSGVVFLFFVILPMFFSEVIFTTTSEGIVASLLVGIFTHTYQLFSEIKSHTDNTVNTIKEHIDKITLMLKQRNQYVDDEWLSKIISDIVAIVDFSKSTPADLDRIKEDIDTAIAHAISKRGTYYIQENLFELNRIDKLNRALEIAKGNVYAVTIDVNEYFDIFWGNINNHYSLTNIITAQRGVKIERIFVMEKYILNKGREEKSKRFWSIVSDLKKGGENVKIFFVELEKLMQHNLSSTSFYIGDNDITSESGEGENNNGGYYSVHDEANRKKLIERFKALRAISKEI